MLLFFQITTSAVLALSVFAACWVIAYQRNAMLMMRRELTSVRGNNLDLWCRVQDLDWSLRQYKIAYGKPRNSNTQNAADATEAYLREFSTRGKNKHHKPHGE